MSGGAPLEQRAIAAERRKKAIALKLGGATWQQISDQLGYPDRSTAFNDVKRALEQTRAETKQSLDELRAQELDRLDRLQMAMWTQAVQGDQKAVESVLKIMDRRIRLLGLDAPIRHEVITVDLITQRIRELSGQLGLPVPERMALPPGGAGGAADPEGAGGPQD